jgi:hypothetical protein
MTTRTTATTAALAQIACADAATWGQTLEAGARSTAAVLAAVYVAGLVLGAWVHHLSEALAALASRPHLTTPQQKAAPPPTRRRGHCKAPAPPREPQAPAQPRQATTPALDVLPVRELRQLARAAGHRALARNGRRTQLLEALA